MSERQEMKARWTEASGAFSPQLVTLWSYRFLNLDTQSSFLEELLFLGTEMWFFEAITGFFLVFKHKFPYPQNYFADIVENTPRNLSGGPLLPKIASVTRFPSLQHRHFLSNVLTTKTDFSTFKLACKSCNLPRFQEQAAQNFTSLNLRFSDFV